MHRVPVDKEAFATCLDKDNVHTRLDGSGGAQSSQSIHYL